MPCLINPPQVTHSVANSSEVSSPVRVLKIARRSYRLNAPITCCDFGLDRIEKFPGADFCHPCKLWDDRDILNKRLCRNSKRYACQRTHESLCNPQKIQHHWWDSKSSKSPAVDVDTALPSSSSMRANVKSRWWNSRAKKDFELWKRFNQQLHDAFHNNNELSSKLNDARKRAEKFRQDLKKANRKLQQMQEKIKKLQSEKDQRKPSSMKDAIP